MLLLAAIRGRNHSCNANTAQAYCAVLCTHTSPDSMRMRARNSFRTTQNARVHSFTYMLRMPPHSQTRRARAGHDNTNMPDEKKKHTHMWYKTERGPLAFNTHKHTHTRNIYENNFTQRCIMCSTPRSELVLRYGIHLRAARARGRAGVVVMVVRLLLLAAYHAELHLACQYRTI